eukprot:CAMPEP_0171462376 /NCGR_PEP_ID=MMETSP0945-20130129/6436_1 /TAXON_ID=109269 /ORGANISM="Vaucheria litorea, Strain CCMP2940" /LENGTH=230 /DNA_ID=CAMNT_0011988885 /DNA_START=257 /DNA_END=949 /DNA_ORIENTATION=-
MNECLDIIQDRVHDETDEELLNECYLLYGLIHARYIITGNGLEVMHRKFQSGDFGKCPRMYCKGCAVIPLGLKDEPNVEEVKLFCPSCEEVYNYQRSCAGRHGSSIRIDGAYFGSTFAPLFCMSFEEVTKKSKPNEAYVPRIFGFRIHRKEGRDIRKGDKNARNNSSRRTISNSRGNFNVNPADLMEGVESIGGSVGRDSEVSHLRVKRQFPNDDEGTDAKRAETVSSLN